MSRPKKPAHLWLKPAEFDEAGRLRKQARWFIRDSGRLVGTGCHEGDLAGAERALEDHIKTRGTLPRERDAD
jgi:hypothetical protein